MRYRPETRRQPNGLCATGSAWAEGEGAAKIRWNSPGDYDRCVVELGKYVGPKIVHGLCQNLHERATGFPAGKAPGDKG